MAETDSLRNPDPAATDDSSADIDDLKRAEAALRQSEERFRLLVEGARDYAMFVLDLDNTITYWSRGAERIFGWSREEAVGQKGAIIFVPEDRKKGAVEQEIATAMQEGRAPDRRWQRRKDGSRLWVDGVLTRLDDESGNPTGLAKVARDATDQQRADEELRHARDQLEQRVLERTAELMATNNDLEREIETRQQLERDLLSISDRERRRIGQDLHDVICQELTATALFLKSTSKNVGDRASAKMLDEAAQVVNRNVGLARDLARGYQPVVVGRDGLVDALRTFCRRANQHPTVTCRLKLPRPIRISDENVALNLFRIAQEGVTNALKHSGATEVVVCVEREGKNIRLVVVDNGKGLRQKKRSKGLGLHIMKYRANVLGGQLRIERPKTGGTEIVCEVPIATNREKPR